MPIFRQRQCGRDYPADTVILHQFPRGPFAPSMSPFCIKIETFLRMAKIPYQSVHSYTMGPKGKSPWVEYNGETLGDSELIMSYLVEKCGVSLSMGLTEEKKAIGRAFQTLVDEHMYWLVLLERWVFHKSEMSGTLTKLPAILIWHISRKTKNMAYAQGLGRHTQSEIETLLEKDLKALSDYLGDKKYFVGEEPKGVDCAVFGQLCQVRYHVPNTVKGRTYLQESLPNLISFMDRMTEKLWPDWEECMTNGFTKEATK
ncbi:failed axon connections homolog isoform X2 [Mya arenaria]|uniref:failed axon connections homolog isoform X2 n=1 Tax=Mya arenaria TaxID=6604 RepID=UPI0022E469C9|nr:failed axon connections homolog isoform X2 [Mya arenaria]